MRQYAQMKKKTISVMLIMTLILTLFTPVTQVSAEVETRVYLRDNRNAQDYTDSNWAERVNHYLVKREDGYMSVSLQQDGNAIAEYFDEDFVFQRQVTIEKELPMAGGFFEGRDFYFLVSGQANPKESDSIEVLRAVKYDKNWNRLGQTSLFGANTTIPFDGGSLRMAESGGKLYIRTCHQMYQSPDGLHHQANLTFVVDESTMEKAGSSYEVGNSSIPYVYVSHSFNQFICADQDGNIICVDHGDAYPRSIYLSRLGVGGQSSSVGKNIMKFSGSIGDNDTGATVGGLESSATSYFTAGTCREENGNRNQLYLSINDRSFSHEAKVIYVGKADEKKQYCTPQLVKISDDKFMLLWTEKHYNAKTKDFELEAKIYYVFFDGNGNLIGDIRSEKGYLSDCHPIVVNDTVMWTVSDNKAFTFYSIDAAGKCAGHKVSYPANVRIYPLDLSTCHFVATKIGPIRCSLDESDYQNLSKYFILMDKENQVTLKYGKDYEFCGMGASCYNGSQNEYLSSVSVASLDGDCYGEYSLDALETGPFETVQYIREIPKLTSVKKTASGVRLRWVKEPYALGYCVYRKTGNGKYQKLATVRDFSQTTFVDKKVRKGGRYSYYIKTFTTNGKQKIYTQKSNIKSVTR